MMWMGRIRHVHFVGIGGAGLSAYANFARAWGAETVILPEAGHINVKSGHGAWEAGYRHLFRLQYLIDSQARRRA